jgi:hypothetical protein
VSLDKRLRHLASRRDETGKLRAMRLKGWERRDILALWATGLYSQKRIAELTMRSPETVSMVLAEKRLKEVEADRDDMRRYYKMAAEMAAAQGNHKPALEWLDRYGEIPETSAQRQATVRTRISARAMHDQVTSSGRGAGPVVNIGIAMPGQLGQTTQNVQVPLALGGISGGEFIRHADSSTDGLPIISVSNELDAGPHASRAKGPRDDESEAAGDQLQAQPSTATVRQSRAVSGRGPSRRAK